MATNYRPNQNRIPANTAPSRIREQDDDTIPTDPAAIQSDGGQEPAELLSESETLRIAQEAYTTSTTYVDSNFRKQWETDLRYFDGRHASDSKYYKDAYKHRAKTFRPKSRSISRRMEALVAAAFFSNDRKADVEAINQDDPLAVSTARMVGNLLDYRLKNTIPWFLTVVGAMQDAVKTGVVCSYNYWAYRTATKKKKTQVPYIDEATGQPAIDPETQEPMMFDQEEEIQVALEDKPDVCLFPVEYVRISPNANWRDPVNTSPYVGRMVPMYVSEVRERMEKPDRHGRKWRTYGEGEIRSAGSLDSFDSTRQTRLGQRQDPVDSHPEVKDYEIVWAIEWFIDRGNGRIVYWTLGTEKLLSDPEPIEDCYLHGQIPITMGFCVVETHKIMPKGLIGLGGAVQRALNNTANNREDNVALVLSKQYFIRSGQQTDTTNLMYGIPGGVTAFNNPKEDVVQAEWNDVTSSGYQEQDRFNVEYDELVGNFSSQSVMTNRALNQTVGGLEILGEGAATLSELTVKTFSESWLIPTLNQLALLEQYYETDEVIMALAAKAAQSAYHVSGHYAQGQPQQQPPQIAEMVDNLIDAKCFVKIEVGMNATDPNRKLFRLTSAVGQVATAVAQMPPSFNVAEYGREIFHILGYGDGSRFWDADQQAQQLVMKAQQQATEMIQSAQKVVEALMENAEKRRKEAEKAEEAAMEEQQQLLREINGLLERGFAVAMRELKVENDSRFGKMEVKLAVAQANAGREKTKAATSKPSGNGSSQPPAESTPSFVIHNHPATKTGGGSRKITLKKGADGTIIGETKEEGEVPKVRKITLKKNKDGTITGEAKDE